ncbi:MAG: hypothetical protein J5I93_07600 [Pirellulaceae bacterium]|nr:hypothetical protein [Pirellulaceae bacterium]
MRRSLRLAGFVCLGLLAAAGVAAWLIYRATQQVPEFYEQVLLVEPQVQEEAGEELEQQVLQLHNEVAEAGDWEAVFTEEQINGWLASDLPEKFSRILPAGVSDPRVLVEPQQARVACRYESPQFRSVIWLDLDIQLTDEPNVLAVRVRQARAGRLPLPLKTFLEQISQQASAADVEVRWTQSEGDPVALVTVPTQHEQYPRREIHLDEVELREGVVYLAGSTRRQLASQSLSSPQAAVSQQFQR